MASRARVFLIGACSGAALAANWRVLVKESLKAGMRGGTVVRRAAVRGLETLADVAHEALWEATSDGGKPEVRGDEASSISERDVRSNGANSNRRNDRSAAKETVTAESTP